MSIESWWCHPTISSSVVPFSFALNLSQHQGLFQWVSFLHQVAKVLEFQLQSFQWYSGLISLRVDWLDLLSVQSTLKNLLSHHNSKASVLQHSACFTVQLSHLYMTTGKTIALIIQTFVSKVMSLFFNMMSRFAIAFLPRSKCFLISWLQSICSDFWAQENKVCHCFHFFCICHEIMGPDARILNFWMLNFKPAFSLYSFIFIKRLFSSSSLSAIRVESSVYLRLLIFLPAILIPVCDSPSLAFHMMYST